MIGMSVMHLLAQPVDAIQINWIGTPSEVKESIVTLKWGIKASSQILDVQVSLNGQFIKGINAIENDGLDMVKSQVLKLNKGSNLVEITVSTTTGQKKSTKTIKLVSNVVNCNGDGLGEFESLDTLLYKAYDGNPKAQYLMANFYLNGTNGLHKDLFESSLWFKKSAEHSYAPSQYEYSVALMEGRGILKNVPLSIYWLTQSANSNYAEALLKLGICYEKGHGVVLDLEKAKELYRKCPLSEAKQRLSALEK